MASFIFKLLNTSQVKTVVKQPYESFTDLNLLWEDASRQTTVTQQILEH